MKVTITYYDTESLTVEEVVKQAVHNYGKNVKVEIMPESSLPHDLIHFGIQQIITHEQLSMLFERDGTYQEDIGKLRRETLIKLSELVDQVIIDNEAKVE